MSEFGESPCVYRDLLSLYATGELCGEESAELESHLALCPECRQELADILTVLEQLRRTSQEPPPGELTREIIEKVSREKSGNGIFVRAVLVAGVALFAVLLYFLIPREKPSVTHPLQTVIEKRVREAFHWLASVQEPDGSWRAEKWGGQPNYTVGVTSLALLALLRTQTTEDAYRTNIEKAIRYLLSTQSEEGFFGPVFSGLPYNHAIATLALLGDLKESRSKRLKNPIKKAVRYICSTQTPEGGWSYLFNPKPNSSISVWQIQALLSAKSFGYTVKKNTIDRALGWLSSLVDSEGYVGYRSRGDFPYGRETLTAMGASCLLLSNRYTGTLERLLRISPTPPSQVDYCYFYFWSEMVARAGRQKFQQNLLPMWITLLERQIREGKFAGSWSPVDRWSKAGGRVYATALATLSLRPPTRSN